MNYVVYKITRSDEKIYIGTTNTERINKRMYQHRYSNRFKGYDFTYEILEESSDYDYIMDMETMYVKEFNSYKEGLNESFDGKNAHLNPNFTTKGYKHTEETKKKMSICHQGQKTFLGKHHTVESREKMSRTRKGKQTTTKLKKDDVIKILNNYKNRIFLDDNRIGNVMKNGRRMSYEQSFSQKFGPLYNVSPQAIRHIIQKKSWSCI